MKLKWLFTLFLFLSALIIFSSKAYAPPVEKWESDSVAYEHRPQQRYYQQQQQYQQQNYQGIEDFSNKAIAMLLDHGVTGLILIVLGVWYYKRQQNWDSEAQNMRKELMEYVKADQISDYDMMRKWQDNTDELKKLEMGQGIIREEIKDMQVEYRSMITHLKQ